jgi:hypothetical protein
MAPLTISNGNGSTCPAPSEALGARPHVTQPAPAVTQSRVSTVSLVIPVRDEVRDIASVLEQIAEYVNEIIVVEGDSIDRILLTAFPDRPDIKLRQAGDAHVGSSTQACTCGKLHAEPLG